MRSILYFVLAMCSFSAVVCGQSESGDALPPLPEGERWTLVWHDEFDGRTLDQGKWIYRTEGKHRKGWWDRKTISLDGKGHLVLRTITENGKYIDGAVGTEGKFEHGFGYYVIRMQFQRQPGHWPAFWIKGPGVMQVGNEGRDGTEIDIVEKPWLNDLVNHALHWDAYRKDHKSEHKRVLVPGVREGFHTFAVWWKPNEYVFYVDGKETWRTDAGGVCQVPQPLILSDEIDAWGGDISKAVLPDESLVDYVRVYDVLGRNRKATPKQP
jgi:beta-glucanase (GH16 family)